MATSTIKKIHPKKFALWIGLTSIVMFFAAFTSAYIVRKSQGDWADFALPEEFFYSTAAIVGSSVLLHAAYKAFASEKLTLFKTFLVSGFVLGLAFVALQYQGWLSLNEVEIFIHSNQHSSFIFMITGFHVAHVLGGIAALLFAMVYAFLPRYQATTPRRLLRLEIIFTYWHFVDALWIYLFIFFMVQQ